MIFLVSHHSSEPLYLQIVRQVQTAILTGVLTPGEGLPSLRQLAGDTGVSLITTKRAYEDLEAEGWVVSQPGRGTVVAEQPQALLEERRHRLVAGKLGEARQWARELGVSRATAEDLWNTLWEDE